jgi:hypothetical protein
MDYIAALESALGTTARKRMLPIQPGDMHSTAADTRRWRPGSALRRHAGARRRGTLCRLVSGFYKP